MLTVEIDTFVLAAEEAIVGVTNFVPVIVAAFKAATADLTVTFSNLPSVCPFSRSIQDVCAVIDLSAYVLPVVAAVFQS